MVEQDDDLLTVAPHVGETCTPEDHRLGHLRSKHLWIVSIQLTILCKREEDNVLCEYSKRLLRQAETHLVNFFYKLNDKCNNELHIM